MDLDAIFSNTSEDGVPWGEDVALEEAPWKSLREPGNVAILIRYALVSGRPLHGKPWAVVVREGKRKVLRRFDKNDPVTIVPKPYA